MGREVPRRPVQTLRIRWMTIGPGSQGRALWLGEGEVLRELGARMVFLWCLVEMMKFDI